VRLNVTVIIGAATMGEFMPGDIYNSAVLVGPTGVLGVYRKTHIAGFPTERYISMERCFYSPGRELSVFDTPVGRLGVHICYDISFPEVARVQALLGAELLVNVSASSSGTEEYWSHATHVRAVENASWYAVCSVVGNQRGSILFGGSRVIDPTGSVVAMGTLHEEDLVIADVDLDVVRRVRAARHLFSIRQPELYEPLVRPTAYP
jgi:predicted amidohydrolase